MKRLIEFRLENGGSIVIEANEPDSPDDVVHAALKPSQVVATAEQTLEHALERIKPAAQAVINSLRTLSSDEIEVEFGLKVNAEAGIFIANCSVEANYVVKLKWIHTQIKSSNAT